MDMEEALKDLEFQKESLKEERRRLNKKIGLAQLELTQLRYQADILKQKQAMVSAEIVALNQPVFSRK